MTTTATTRTTRTTNLDGSCCEVLQQQQGTHVELAPWQPAGEGVHQIQLLLGQAGEEGLQQLQHRVPDGLVRRLSRRIPDELEVFIRQLPQPG